MSDNKSKKRGLFGWFGKKDDSSQQDTEQNATPEEQAIEADLEEQLEIEHLNTEPLTKEAPEAKNKPLEKSPAVDTSDKVQADDSSEEKPEELARRDNRSTQPIDFEEDSEPVHSESPEPTAQPQDKPSKKGFFSRLKDGLSKTRSQLTSGIADLVLGSKQIDDDLLEEIETQLLMADVGVEATRRIVDDLTEKAARKELKDPQALMGRLRLLLSEILAPCTAPLELSNKPHVILMVGVNGVGKTTTIGKLAKKFQQDGKSVMLAAGDTFRAAAVEQLQVWGERNNIHVTAQHTGADSASVIYDALQSAQRREIDVLIADTAGRLHNKSNLMDELVKVKRVMQKLDPDAPHEVMLVVDAGTGQNALNQTEQFHKAINLTGITVTKLDGTAKGGIIFALADKLEIPIRFIGVGEGIDDLRQFDAEDFIQALFSIDKTAE